MKHSSFTDIGQFRNVVTTIKKIAEYDGKDDEGNVIINPSKTKPVLKFIGTTKTHGTNFGIFQRNGQIWHQSRENIITPLKDNAGASMFGEARKTVFENMFKQIRTELNIDDNLGIGIFGEFIGKGIQSGVGVNHLEKSLIIFAIKVVDFDDETKNYYVSNDTPVLRNIKSPENRIYNIYDFPIYEIEIDFNDPVDVANKQNQLIEIAKSIGDECPVAKQLLADRIANGETFDSMIGEGVVMTSNYKGNTLILKEKDERHAKGSKPKISKPVDSEKIAKLIDLADKVTPVWRLEQMLEKTCDFMNGGTFDRSKIGDFIRHVFADIVKEDTDVLIQEEVEIKQINKYVSDICRKYFFDKEKDTTGI